MADGNFNRSPLASNNYQSGVRAGKSAMRALAIKAFENHLDTHMKEINEEARNTMLRSFKESLQ